MLKKKIAIINLKTSNLKSIFSACQYLNFDPTIIEKKQDLTEFSSVILPGVGAFGSAINAINNLELETNLEKFIRTGKVLLGICLGMQILLSSSEEFGYKKGLNYINGKVVKFNNNKIHIGWNKVNFLNNQKTVKNNNFMYFVHSYYVKLENKSLIESEANFNNINFCSSFVKDNIYGCQFHPEKSGMHGLKFLKKILNT